MPYLVDFNVIAAAIVLYYEQRDSLFAEQVIFEKLGEKIEIIRSEIQARTGTSPEQLVRVLEPAHVRRVISKTVESIKGTGVTVPDIQITPMSSEEMGNGGERLSIHFQFAPTPFGPTIIASTPKGVCYLAFSDEGNGEALSKLKKRFPNAACHEGRDDFQMHALSLFENMKGDGDRIHLHLKGTVFQIRIWEKLLTIPLGGLMSYSALADDPKDSHALGAAVGSNPIAYIIPCNRAVLATGEFGDYHWGSNRKAALICLESAGGSR